MYYFVMNTFFLCRFSTAWYGTVRFTFVFFPLGTTPPGGGGGGVERSLGITPRPARGDGDMCRVGRGREPWERSEAGGVNDNERHLRHSPVSSPTEELRKE